MAKMQRPAPHKPRDLGSGNFGFGRQNSAASAVKIAGDQGRGGMKAGTARRMDHHGNMAPKTQGHCVGGGSKKGI